MDEGCFMRVSRGSVCLHSKRCTLVVGRIFDGAPFVFFFSYIHADAMAISSTFQTMDISYRHPLSLIIVMFDSINIQPSKHNIYRKVVKTKKVRYSQMPYNVCLLQHYPSCTVVMCSILVFLQHPPHLGLASVLLCSAS